jgi:DNA invertase Pin-like site-specific DNA recombinase
MDALKRAKCTRIYQEKASGAKAERPELMKLLDSARKGDVVIVWKLDRMARRTLTPADPCFGASIGMVM